MFGHTAFGETAIGEVPATSSVVVYTQTLLATVTSTGAMKRGIGKVLSYASSTITSLATGTLHNYAVSLAATVTSSSTMKFGYAFTLKAISTTSAVLSWVVRGFRRRQQPVL